MYFFIFFLLEGGGSELGLHCFIREPICSKTGFHSKRVNGNTCRLFHVVFVFPISCVCCAMCLPTYIITKPV